MLDVYASLYIVNEWLDLLLLVQAAEVPTIVHTMDHAQLVLSRHHSVQVLIVKQMSLRTELWP